MEERPTFDATGKPNPLPAFPFGAVYFRKSNPPREDWERDYRTASEDGMNVFRHWFLWSGIEIEPGRYDWSDYDRQLELGAANGIKAIIAEMITVAPEWTYRKYPQAVYRGRDGTAREGFMHGSCATGGTALCMDNGDAKAAAETFLRTLAHRYKNHPGLGGYDIWNECGAAPCYCAATAARFREWLTAKYGDLPTLGEAWHRYGYADWDDIFPPRHEGPWPDVLDWTEFHIESAHLLMRWRYEVIRAADPNHPITAHGVAGSLTSMAERATDDWRAAAEVESYGYTWGSCRHGDEPWKQFHAVDLVRASSRGKPFWHAEAYGGPLWMAPNVIGKPRNEGRIASPEDIRYWHMVSFMAGATGSLYLRWRPLLDGPLFGAFGPYGMDGSRTARSAMSSRTAKWVTSSEQAGLWKSRPVKGEIGIIYVPETQVFTQAQQGNTSFYSQSMRGAYQGFFDNNIQADWVHIRHIDERDALYLPFPVMLNRETADRLRVWVEAGGTLVCEGCPAYFGERGRVGTTQPNYGLDELFGAQESYVEFTPDLLGDLRFNLSGMPVRGGIFMQVYEPTTGTPCGWYEDGRIAAVDHSFGRGKTRLIGTMCGAGYAEHPTDRWPTFFADVLRLCGKEPHVTCSEPRVKARIHDGSGGTYLWVANPVRSALPVRLELGSAWGSFSSVRTLRSGDARVNARTVDLTAPARDVMVLELVK